jgi:hypothetical protein
MNKVITINLNGVAYQIDEDGYHLLQDYLVAAEDQLKDNPDQQEIVTDLEEAIADKCRRFLAPNKDVISTEEVRTILEEMGTVESEDSESDTDNKGTGGEHDSRRTEHTNRDRQAPRRL